MTQFQIVNMILKDIKLSTPFRTGNLSDSTKMKRVSENKWEIFVDSGDDAYLKDYPRGQAPYVPFVNEVWISPRWNGKMNPNQSFWNEGVTKAMNKVAKRVGGRLELWM